MTHDIARTMAWLACLFIHAINAPAKAQAEAREFEVEIRHGTEAPAFAGTLTLPDGAGPHPAALLMSPAGKHPRDELRAAENRNELANLAARLARAGIASLRIDNRGVGGSKNDAWQEWSFDVTLDAMAKDQQDHLAWLRDRKEIDRHRTGVIAHGDATPVAARVAARSIPAFAVLLSPVGTRPLDNLVRMLDGRLPAELGADDRSKIKAEMRGCLELLVKEGATEDVIQRLRPAFEALGTPESGSERQARGFAKQFDTRWHRAFLADNTATFIRRITCPLLAIGAADDRRWDTESNLGRIERVLRQAAAYQAKVVTVERGGHFLEDQATKLLSNEVVRHVVRFVTEATGHLRETGLPGGPRGRPPPVFIDGATVIDVAGGRRIARQSILLAEGRIRAVGDVEAPAGARTVDGRGLFVMPGLCDAHVHLSLWGPDALARLVAHGVTSVRDMGGDLQLLTRWRAAIEEGKLLGPRLRITGPFLDGKKPNDLYRRFLLGEEDVAPAIEELHAAKVDFLKVHSRLPLAVLPTLARLANERGLPFGGHAPAGWTPAQASEAGFRSLEHADGFFLALVRAQPSPAPSWPAALAYWRSEKGDADLARIKKAATFVVPTLAIIDTGARRVGGIFRTLAPWTREMTRRIHAAGIPIVSGTDLARGVIGMEPGVSLHRELALLVQAGLSPGDALRATTLTAAEMLGLEAVSGTIEKGKQADLVLLEADPLRDIANVRRIRAVVVRGHFMDREDLARAQREALAVRER